MCRMPQADVWAEMILPYCTLSYQDIELGRTPRCTAGTAMGNFPPAPGTTTCPLSRRGHLGLLLVGDLGESSLIIPHLLSGQGWEILVSSTRTATEPVPLVYICLVLGTQWGCSGRHLGWGIKENAFFLVEEV